MRWHLLFMVLILVSLPIVSAEECNGEFSISPEFLQFGDDFLLKGTNLIYDNDTHTGNLIIELESAESNHEIFGYAYKGDFEIPGFFSSDLDLNTGGDFKGTLKLIKNGNTVCTLEDALEFEVSNKLIAVSRLDKSQLDPGEVLELKGEVSYKNGDKVENGEVIVNLDGKEYNTALSNGEFDFSLSTATTIRSNVHELRIFVEDEAGNFADDAFKFYINPIVSKVDLELDKNGINPGEVLTVYPRVYDQAGEEIVDNLEVRIYDTKDDRVFKQTLLSGQAVNYQVASEHAPGEWTVKAKYEDIIAESKFNVKELISLNVELEEQILVIKNIGNVKYVEDLEFTAISEGVEDVITKRTKITPGEELRIELFKELNSGIYNINVRNTGQVFENLEILDERGFFEKGGDFFLEFTGNAVKKSGSSTSDISSYFAIAMLAFVVLLVLFFRYRPSGGGVHIDKVVQHNTSKGNTSVDPAKNLDTKSSKEDIADFKSRILKDIRETEKRKVEKEKAKEEKPWRYSGKQVPKKKFEFREKTYGVKAPELPKVFDFDKPMKKKEPAKNEEETKETANLFKMFD